MKIKMWIEAMRLRTLPVSVAGVIGAIGYCFMADCFRLPEALCCLFFAILAQVASNFANEYYDFKAGIDRPGREGPRRGVTEGDITPDAMKGATYGVLGVACAIGLYLAWSSGWWLILVGAFIALAALAYSTGPYPLSQHALGEVAVIVFFGLVPVNFTFFVQSGYFNVSVLVGSLALGLIASDILIVNNYRDVEDDAAVNKETFAVKYGRSAASGWYLLNGYAAAALMLPAWVALSPVCLVVPVIFVVFHTLLWWKMTHLRGRALTPILGMTAANMLFYSLGFMISALG